MWSNENRARYDRGKMRYPSDVTDEEWALVEPHIPPARRGGAKRTVSVREVVNGLMYVLSTGCQWRAIPKDLPPRSTVYDDFDLWSWDGTLDRIVTLRVGRGYAACMRESSPCQFHGSNSESFVWDVSAMRARTSASHACGSRSLSLAIPMSVYISAARSAPRSDPANNHDFLPSARPRRARSAALLLRQMRPSSRKRMKDGQRVSM